MSEGNRTVSFNIHPESQWHYTIMQEEIYIRTTHDAQVVRYMYIRLYNAYYTLQSK